MSAYMGAGSMRVGVQVQGCPLVNTTSRREIKERVMYVLYCCVPGRSSDPAHERSHSRVCWLSTRFTAGPLPRNYPGAHNAVLQTPLAIASPLISSPLLFYSKPHIYLLIPVFVRLVSCHLFQFHLPSTARVRSWRPVPRPERRLLLLVTVSNNFKFV